MNIKDASNILLDSGLVSKEQYLNQINNEIEKLTLKLLRGKSINEGWGDKEKSNLIKNIMGLELLKEWLVNPKKAMERKNELKNVLLKNLRGDK